MVQAIGYHGVIRRKKSLIKTSICIKAGRVENGVFCSKKSGDPLFKLTVKRLGATDETHRSCSKTPPLERLTSGFHNSRMTRKPQIVVRAHVEDLPTIIQPDHHVLRGTDQFFALIQTPFLDFL